MKAVPGVRYPVQKDDGTIELLVEAIHDAVSNGEGQIYARALADALKKHGLVVVEIPKSEAI